MNLLAYCIVALAGWTLAANGVVLVGGSLRLLVVVGPVASVLALIALCFWRPTSVAPTAVIPPPAVAPEPSEWRPAALICMAAAITALQGVSWVAFWAAAVCYLIFTAKNSRSLPEATTNGSRTREWPRPLVLMCIANALLALWVVRPDQDDAFYVGVSAFAAGHPSEALLAFDPMLAERSWPLIFPSYRFASYELLVAAIAHVSGMSAITIAHVALPPLAAAAAILATYSLARELRPSDALVTTFIFMLLTVVLGETARSPANFGFDRIFQGKAVLLSVIIPSIYTFTFRYTKRPQGRKDLYVLGCAYLAAIGTSNFGMLIAPIAGLTAAAAAYGADPSFRRRSLEAGALAIIPLPYLVWVAAASHAGSALANVPLESAAQVWTSTFGRYGQYLIAFTLLMAPALAGDRIMGRLLSIPTLVFLGLGLNPLLSAYIARFLTTPPVYWRMTWQIPVLIVSAAAIATLIGKATDRHKQPTHHVVYASALLGISAMILWLAQFSTLNHANGTSWAFAQPKLLPGDVDTAEIALGHAQPAGRILAPDNVSSIIAMKEHHPPLVVARSMYIYMLRDLIPRDEYETRMRLAIWVNGNANIDDAQLAHDLGALDVRVVVRQKGAAAALRDAGFAPAAESAYETIWVSGKAPDREPFMPRR
ncbi:DUF6077 domain-containing protein [Luteibacter sp. Lutesp34]|uniref:DUF6077 domain-containing protein n=1 Tax=Luteibacter sp. Lutesp34 TaxID=3243030 RepID=UPI0039B3B47F